MKHVQILAMLFFTLSQTLMSQDFGAVGTKWHYSENAGGACPGNCEFVYMESVSDTVIAGEITHKIIRTYFTQHKDTVHYQPIYLYEQMDTVFMWDFSKSKFLTVFIFNSSIGDTLTLDVPEPFLGADTTYRLVIDTITNHIADGVTLKKYKTTPLDIYSFFNGGYFMDRIGGLDWFFPRANIIPEAGGPIRCYSDSQVDSNFQSVACDYILYTSIDEFSIRDDIEIYPNPVFNQVQVQSTQRIDRIELYDLMGQILCFTDEMSLDVSTLPHGVYIVRVYLANGQTIEKKVVK